MSRLYFDKKEIKEHFEKFVDNLTEQGVSEDEIQTRVAEHYTNKIVRVYSRAEQDRMWDYILYMINEVPGGYWHIVENMNYMPEFEHYRFRCLKSAFGSKGTRHLPKDL